jgi:hypothetical protein
MFATFSQGIRKITLALAAAAIAYTTLASTIAAAPADSLPRPSGSEIAAIDPSKLDLPVSDIQVWGGGHTGDRYSVQYFNFRVKNLGPDPARVKIKREVTTDHDDWDHRVTTVQESITIIPVGVELIVSAVCQAPTGGECFGGEVAATVMNGIDPGTTNNSSSWDWGQ